MSIGFIKLHRKIVEWEWYSDANVCRVFLHLLLTANFENKKWQGIDISRGQVITSLEKLGKSTTLTIQQVRTALTKLKSTHEITIKATKLHTFITLTNYNLYQDKIIESNTLDSTPDNNSSTKNQQKINKESTTTKEEKEIQEGEKDKKKPKGFIAPTLQEVQDYCKSRNSSVSANKFFDYYSAGNWKDAKGNPVKNWKQKLLTWESKDTTTKPVEIDSFCQSLNKILKQDLIEKLTENPDTLTIKLFSASSYDKWEVIDSETKNKIKELLNSKFNKKITIKF